MQKKKLKTTSKSGTSRDVEKADLPKDKDEAYGDDAYLSDGEEDEEEGLNDCEEKGQETDPTGSTATTPDGGDEATASNTKTAKKSGFTFLQFLGY